MTILYSVVFMLLCIAGYGCIQCKYFLNQILNIVINVKQNISISVYKFIVVKYGTIKAL